ncbi:MAG: PEP-CTERM-box response regulator transcription factor [Nitrospirae bacterium]|nr:PEP-CTERM-box response regulator transcription factor [Nitrospirota bacterium]
MEKILIIEDNPDIQTQMKWGLSKEFIVLQAGDRSNALRLFKKNMPKVVTLDLGLPPDGDGTGEGMECLKAILSVSPNTKVIIITGNNEKDNALRAIQAGAYDYYCKPIDMNEIKVIIKRAVHLHKIEEENRSLHASLHLDIGFSGMIGQSSGMTSVFDVINKVATTDITVLITGESGTGKELVARAIHENSLRSGGSFIPINCGAIPETLLESELFGHEKGSFTGAYMRQKGKFEYAHKGTLLLDEIGELSLRLQVKLLRFLQEKKIQRIGNPSDIEIDTRVIAATNVDLQKAIKDGKFREDLFYRLSVVAIALPPLRERGDDIRLLANVFLEKNKSTFRKKIKGFSPAALAAIVAYLWPGNVRELENKMQKAIIMSQGPYIEPRDLGLAEPVMAKEAEVEDLIEGPLNIKEARKKLEIEYIRAALNKHMGNMYKASEELGISRPTLYALIERYGLELNYSVE